jgi:uncharacterized protein YkwD
MRQVLTRLGLLALVGWLAVGAPTEAAASSWERYRPDAAECGFLAVINDYRASKGLHRLKLSATLGAAAEHHSADMARNNVFSHTLSTGTSWSTNILSHRYVTGAAMAENIAAGRSSARGVFSLWVNSPGHKANMLSRSMYAIGIGRASDASSKYDWYWTTTFGGRSSRLISC